VEVWQYCSGILVKDLKNEGSAKLTIGFSRYTLNLNFGKVVDSFTVLRIRLALMHRVVDSCR